MLKKESFLLGVKGGDFFNPEFLEVGFIPGIKIVRCSYRDLKCMAGFLYSALKWQSFYTRDLKGLVLNFHIGTRNESCRNSYLELKISGLK